MLSSLRSGFFRAGMLLSFAAYGQEMPIPLGALPMQFNPSFAGEAGGPRFSSSIGLRTAGGDRSNSYTLNASYDQFIPALRSGVGFSGRYLNASSRLMSSAGYAFSAAIAPKFSLKGKYTISPSLELTYGSSNVTINNWVVTNEPRYTSGYAWQSRAGLLVNTRKWYFGYSIDIPLQNTYQYNLAGILVFQPARFNSYWQFGYTFQRSSESRFSFTPQIAFRTGTERYGDFRYFGPVAINLNFRYQKFIWGINNSGIHLGWQTDRVRVMLSNGYSSEGRETGYTGNATFRYMLKNSDR